MPRRSNFFRRGAIYYWRRRVPTRLGELIPETQWCVSLRTPFPDLARTRAHRVTAAVDQLIAETQRRMTDAHKKPTAAELQQAFRDLFAQLIQEFQDARMPADGIFSDDPRVKNKYLAEGYNEDPAHHYYIWSTEKELNSIDLATKELLPTLHDLGLEIPANEREQRALARHATEVATRAGLLFAEMETGGPRPATDEVFAELGLTGELPLGLRACTRPDDPAEANDAADAIPEHHVPASWRYPVAPTPAQRAELERTFASVGKEYMESKLPGSSTPGHNPDLPYASSSWKNIKTKDDQLRSYRLFTDLVGDLPMAQIEPRHAMAFKRELMKMPADHGRNEYEGLTATQSIHKADEVQKKQTKKVKQALRNGTISREDKEIELSRAQVQRMSLNTQNKHIDACQKTFKYFIKIYQMPMLNPFDGVRYKSSELNRRAHEEREAWEDHELAALFQTSCWTGCKSPNYRHRPGPHIYKDAKYWIPLLLAHHGLRLEEPAQMWLEDVISVEDDYALIIRKAEERDVKTPSSARIIPLHPLILKLGFLSYVADLKANGHKRLFPELSKDKWHDSYGTRISKWFGRYRKLIDIGVKDKDLHSFRHSFDTHLGDKNVNLITIQDLMGHARPRDASESVRRYRKPAAFEKLRAVINQVDYGIKLVEGPKGWQISRK